MYTDNFYKLVHAIFTLSTYAGISRIGFNLKSRSFIITRKTRWNCIIALASYSFFLVFWLFRTVDIMLHKGGYSNQHFHITYLFTFVAMIQVPGLIVLHQKQDDMFVVFNQTIRYFKYFEKEWMPNYNPTRATFSRIMDVLLALLLLGCCGAVPLNSVHYLMFPETPIYFPTLLPHSWRSSPVWVWIYLGNSILAMGPSLISWMTVMTLLSYCVIYVFSMLPLVIRELRIGVSGYLSRSSLRTVRHLPHEYLCVELLHKQAFHVAGPLLFGTHGALSQFILLCNFAVIKHWNELDIPTKMLLGIWSLAAQGLWVIVLEFAGRFCASARKTLKSWKLIKATKIEMKYMSKFKRRCRPLKLGKEGLFTINRLSVLKFLRAIVKGTFRALLTMK